MSLGPGKIVPDPDLISRALRDDVILTRRRFLQLAGVSAAVIHLGGCERACRSGDGASNAPASTTSAVPDDPPFSVWREMRDAVRTSPDHLAARAARLVESRDPEAIFRFVRDEIVTIPAYPDAFGSRTGDALGQMRWGIRGTLRCGMGTPREKAELFASLLRDAGFQAEVVAGTLDPAVDRKALLLRTVRREFAPDVSPEQWEAWRRVLGVRPGPLRIIDADGRESAALGDRILDALPADTAAPPFDFSLTRVPLVRLVHDGTERYANPLVPDAAFGDARATRIAPVARASTLRPIEVLVQVSNTDDPSRRITVAHASWPFEDVVGRRIVLQFAPVGDLRAALRTPPNLIRAFTPVLVLDDVHATREELIERAVVGSMVTVGGDVVDGNDSRRVQAAGLPIAGSETSPSNVAQVDVTASASGFPLVRLRVSARDAAGAPVHDLAASAFAVMEDGRPLPFLMRQSRPPAPRLLLLFDQSGSLPADFRGRGAAVLGRRIAEAVLERQPDALMQVATVVLRSAAGVRSWTKDPATVEAAVRTATGWGSKFWSALGEAGRYGANIIALITDGRATDTPEERAKARAKIAAGPPVVSIAVGDVDRSSLDEIATLTGGATFTADDHEQAIEAILSQLNARGEQSIVIEYEAPPEGPERRTVEVRAGTGAGTDAYRVPPPAERAATPALAGIYLVIRRGSTEITRTLAGLPHDRRKSEPVDQALRDEVRAALFGTTLLSVEAGAPTLSAWLDDMLTARLTWKPLWEVALGRNDIDGFVKALESGIRTVPSHTLLLHPRLEQADEALTFETEPRMLLLNERPLPDDTIVRTADILSASGWATVAEDPREAFRLTVRRTARLAVAESALFPDSTPSRLGDRVLRHIPARGARPRDGIPAEWANVLHAYSGRHQLVPADEGPFAFWAVDGHGALLGVLPDGSGGGIAKDYGGMCKNINRTTALNQLLSRMFGMPFAFGALVLFAKAVAKQYLIAAAMVESLGDDTPDLGDCGKPSDFACDLLKDAATDMGPAAGVGIFEDLWELGFGDDLIKGFPD